MEPIVTWWEMVVGAFGSFMGALGGVLLRRQHKHQQGDPSAWNHLWVEAPTLFVMGLIGHGIGVYLSNNYGMPELFGHILSAILGYLGPAAIDMIVAVARKRLEGDLPPAAKPEVKPAVKPETKGD